MRQDSDSESSTSDPLDLTQDEGWEDVEPEEQSDPVVSLFSDTVFPDARSMLEDCKQNFQFDFLKVRKELDLDFLESVKLVNYIRAEVKAGNLKPDVSSKALFEDEKYMKPTMEDDALLYSLDDLDGTSEEQAQEQRQTTSTVANTTDRRVQELEAELERMRGEFVEYKTMVQKLLDKELDDEEGKPGPSGASVAGNTSWSKKFHEEESNYFTSYSYNAIHESMLKDAVRTDSYRDFIYDNKHLFKDKVVLDVGCGTGILSMFCAKAGAKQVIAVDNSDIIDRAREIVYENGFGDVITCLRGKIEEVALPVQQVDIIVSEWMGYCLLFEAMFDSVIWARDRYLVPGGLMVPSHATLQIAPISDSELVDDHVSFWKSIYGFNMSSMLLGIHDEAIVEPIKPSTLAAKASPFLQLPLHTITVDELTFVKQFEVTLAEDIETLDGWAIWFDIFFMPSPESKVPLNAVPSDMRKEDFVAFTTGPDGTVTHWQQGIFLINREKLPRVAMKKDQIIKGSVGYRKKEEKSRFLDIEIQWDAGDLESGRQQWSLV